MPLSKYFRGSGEKVMASMKRHYGSKKGERVFYATANKMKMKHGKVREKLAKFMKSGAFKKVTTKSKKY